jgi:phasin
MPEDNPAKKSFEPGAKTTREAIERGTAAAEQTTKRVEQSFESTADGMRKINEKMLEIGQANMKAGLDFVSELARAKGPPEVFEIWSRHAQSHLQRLGEQSQELVTLGQRIAEASTRPLTRGLDHAFARAS